MEAESFQVRFHPYTKHLQELLQGRRDVLGGDIALVNHGVSGDTVRYHSPELEGFGPRLRRALRASPSGVWEGAILLGGTNDIGKASEDFAAVAEDVAARLIRYHRACLDAGCRWTIALTVPELRCVSEQGPIICFCCGYRYNIAL